MNKIQLRVLEELKKLYCTNYPLGCVHDCFGNFDPDMLLSVKKLNDKEEFEILREFIAWGLKHEQKADN